jgi:hypothetical protein
LIELNQDYKKSADKPGNAFGKSIFIQQSPDFIPVHGNNFCEFNQSPELI